MAKLIMTPANKDWNKIPVKDKGFIDNAIAMACKKYCCPPEGLVISAVFENGILQIVRTKKKGK